MIMYLCYVIYFVVGWTKIKLFKKSESLTRYPKVSVIIPVRNEEAHIAELLTDIHNQSYPREFLDVIVINDSSTDNTVKIIEELNYSNVRVIDLKVDAVTYAYKKMAISLGVENSEAELIVTTDGDCRMGTEWINTIVDFYLKHNCKLISAPVTYQNEKSWFEKIQTVEFLYLIGAAAACIRNGMPNTCNGANMAYTRELFYDVSGYDGIDILATGDDESLLHKVYKKYPKAIGFLKSKDAIVSTYANSKFKKFIHQRKRWASNSSEFHDKRAVMMVVIIFLFNLSLVCSAIFSIIESSLLNYLWIALGAKIVLDGIFFIQMLSFFNKQKLIPYILLVEFFYSFYIVYIGLLGKTGAGYTWKDRNVK